MPVVNPALVNPLSPSEGPCAWPIDTSCCPDWDTYTPELQASATAWATDILWPLSGRRFGPCEITVRPCGSTCNFAGGWMTWPVALDGGNAAAAGGWFPFVDQTGVWRNCGCAGVCSCSARCEVFLPGPVAGITEVMIDGIVIPAESYRVDNQELLVRTDGECWPECQDMNLDADPVTGIDTFSVTYSRGTPVPVSGQIAAGILACDFAKTCLTGCKLPGNLSSLSRQGIEVTAIDPTDLLEDGLTGIAQVDTWLRAVNPYKLRERSRLYSPDLNYQRMPG